MKTITHKYVKMEDMNHHGSLYANTLASWMLDAAFFGIVEVLGRQDHVVMVGIQDFRFLRPAELGALLELRYELEKAGTSSLTLKVEARDKCETEKIYSTCLVVFVNTDEEGKSAPHGIHLE